MDSTPQERRDNAVALVQEAAALALLDSIQEHRANTERLEESWEIVQRGRGLRYDDTDQDYTPLRFNYGAIQTPYSYIDDRRGQRWLPWYEHEWDLRALRAQIRLVDAFSTMAIGAKAQLVNYTFGSGWDQSVKPIGDGDETPLSREANAVLNRVLDENGWGREYRPTSDGSPATNLACEIMESSIADETLVTINEDQRQIRIDVEDPSTLTEPARKPQLEDWLEGRGDVRRGAVHSWWYGVHTINRRRGKAFVQDMRRPVGYHFSFTESGDEWDYKPSREVVHFKRNVPGRAPRGVSDYAPVLYDLEKDPKLMAAMASGEISRQNIVYIREITGEGATHSDLDSILSAAAGGTVTVPARNQGSSEKNLEHLDKLRIPTLRGSQYKPGPDGRSVSAAVEVQQALRRSIGIRWSMNEGFISMDFSNNNLASQLAAESPFVIARQRDQGWYSLKFQELFWKILWCAHRLGQFARGMQWHEVVGQLKIVIETSEVASRDPQVQATRDQALHAMGVKSARTIATEHGLDYDAEQQNREQDGDEVAGPLGIHGMFPGVESVGGPTSPFLNPIHEQLRSQIWGNLLEHGSHNQKDHGKRGSGGSTKNVKGSKKERAESLKIANARISSAPVPSKEAVKKARRELKLAREGKIRAGGESRGGSAKARRRQRENLFNEWGGQEKGYVVCPWTGIKMHHTDDPKKNPNGYPKFERGKIFVKCQGGGYQLPNLIPESFAANRSRNAQRLRKENSDGC